jgi:hypothetical protein
LRGCPSLRAVRPVSYGREGAFDRIGSTLAQTACRSHPTCAGCFQCSAGKCQRRRDFPQKWRRKIPQSGGLAISHGRDQAPPFFGGRPRGVWLRRVRFVIFTPDSPREFSTLSGRKSNYISLLPRFPKPALTKPKPVCCSNSSAAATSACHC